MSGSQQGPPSDRSSPSTSPRQPFLLHPPFWFPTQPSQRPPSLNHGPAAPIRLCTPIFSPVLNLRTQLQTSADSPLPTADHHFPTSTTPTMNSIPDTSRDNSFHSNQQPLYTQLVNNNIPLHMTQDLHSAVNGLNNSLESAVVGTCTQPENTAAEVPTENLANEGDLDNPSFLVDFLPGGTYHDGFYLNMNNPVQNQLPITDSDLNVEETPIQVRPAGEQHAEGQPQKSMTGNPATGNIVLDHFQNNHLNSGGQQDTIQYPEGSSNIGYPPEMLIGYRPGGLPAAQDFPAQEAPSAEHSSAQGPESQLHGQEQSPAGIDNFNTEIPQATVGDPQIASTQNPGSLTSNRSSAPLRVQNSALAGAPSLAPSKSQGRKGQEETRWVKGIFYHRNSTEEHWCRFLQKFP